MVASGKIKQIVIIFTALAWLAAGCHMYRPGRGNLVDRGYGPAQKIVEDRATEQRERKTGQERWENFKLNEYQSLEDIARSREEISRERGRGEEARQLMEAGPLQLLDCIALGLEFNDRVQGKRMAIQAVGGNELIVRSRFLPHLFYGFEQEEKERETSEESRSQTDHFFRLSQTLLEFGKDSAEDVVLRESQRDVLFGYEDAVSGALSGIRLKFFTILLRQQQLAERVELLGEFRDQYERIRKRYEKRQVVEVDVLTARLNMLNEETRINSLKKEILRQKIDLLHLIGVPVGMTNFELQGELEALEVDLSRAVDIALKRSTGIAQARSVVAEQRRKARQVWWEYGPDLHLQSGWKDSESVAGIELTAERGTYGLSPFAEYHLESPEDGFLGDQDVLEEDEGGSFLGLTLELPIFQGLERRGRYVRERALLYEARHGLRDTIDSVELNVSKAYQTMLERREELAILVETVEISKKRLKAKERLKELGKVSDDELETFRDRFFRDQDAYFSQQIAHIASQERLRFLMRFFEALPAEETKKDELPE